MSAKESAPSAGLVKFADPATKQFLLFIPSTIDKTLKLLIDSMWFKVQNPTYGECYRAAASLESLKWLRDMMGPLRVAKDVFEWQKQNTTIIPIEEIDGLPLFDFQREAVGFLIERERAMLSLSPGLGKTITSITAICLSRELRKVLVVAPLSLLYMWKSELEKWRPAFGLDFKVSIWHKLKNTEDIKWKPSDRNQILWVIANPETAVKHKDTLIGMNFDAMIMDESILYKNRNSQRTKAILEISKAIPVAWELTGIPADRMLDDLWSQFHILYPKRYTSYWRFASEYCLVVNSGWSNAVVANRRKSEEKVKERFQDIYFARSQDEVLNIPEWIFESIDIPMLPKQEKLYRELSSKLIAELETDEGTVKITVSNHLAKVVRLIQLASSPRLLDDKDGGGKEKAILELMEYYPKPFIVWTSFIKTNHMLTDLFQSKGYRADKMLGETSSEGRQEVVDKFQDGKLDVLVVGQSVGSFGHTLTAGRTAIYPERTYDGSYSQSLYRFRRIGTTQSPNVVHLRSVHANGKKTIDHLVDSLLDYRLNMIRELTTGMLLEALHE